MFTCGSNKIVWWKCSKCGSKWKSAIANRTAGTQCPTCRKKKKDKTQKFELVAVGQVNQKSE